MQKSQQCLGAAAFLVASFFVFLIGSTQAAEGNPLPSQGFIVADVSIFEAHIISQEGNKLTLAFDIFNRGGVQPNIRYGLELVRKLENGQSEIIQHVFEDFLLLKSEETVHKELVYTAPQYLDGTYEVWVVSQNDKALPLSQALAGKATFQARTPYIVIDENTCSVSVQGEQAKEPYLPSFGVDISKEETLIAICEIRSKFDQEMRIKTKLETYFRSMFGKLLATSFGDVISLRNQERRVISFPLPKEQKAQAYDVNLSLTDEQGRVVSNIVKFHYVLRGASGTLQNVRLDKDAYQKGETAKISFFWTGAADAFVGARGTGSQTEFVRVEVKIDNADGSVCVPTTTKEAKASRDEVLEFPAVMEKDCPFPKVTAMLKDPDGKVLDQIDFAVVAEKSKQDQLQTDEVQIEANSSLKTAGAVALALLFLGGILIVGKKMKSRPVASIFLAIGMAIGCWFCTGVGVQAVSWTEAPGPGQATYEVTLDHATYVPGEAVKATGTIGQLSRCSNGDAWGRMGGRFPTTNPPVAWKEYLTDACAGGTWVPPQVYTCTTTLFQPGNWCFTPGYGWWVSPYVVPGYWSGRTCNASWTSGASGNLIGIAPNVAGTHYGYFNGVAYIAAGETQTWGGEYSIAFTVSIPNADGKCGTAISTPSLTKPAANLCGDGSLPAVTDNVTTWNWTCKGTGTGKDVPCNVGHTYPAPTLDLTFNDGSSIDKIIAIGQSETLKWTPGNVDSCSATSSSTNDGGWATTATKDASSGTHTQIVLPTVAGTYTYTLTCKYSVTGNQVTKSLNLTVNNPAVTISATPSVISGSLATVTWNPSYVLPSPAGGCWLYAHDTVTLADFGGDWVSTVAGEHTKQFTVANTTNFRIHCWNNGVDSGTQEATTVVTYKCNNAMIVSNSKKCIDAGLPNDPNDESGLSGDLNYTLSENNACNDNPKCEYVCKSNYYYKTGACLAKCSLLYSPYGPCDKTCGGGKKYRYHTDEYAIPCKNDAFTVLDPVGANCNTQACPPGWIETKP